MRLVGMIVVLKWFHQVRAHLMKILFSLLLIPLLWTICSDLIDSMEEYKSVILLTKWTITIMILALVEKQIRLVTKRLSKDDFRADSLKKILNKNRLDDRLDLLVKRYRKGEQK